MFVNETPAQTQGVPRAGLALGTLWLERRGLGYNHEKAIKGREGPDLQKRSPSA